MLNSYKICFMIEIALFWSKLYIFNHFIRIIFFKLDNLFSV